MNTLLELKLGLLNGETKIKISEQLSKFPEEILILAETLEVLDLSGNLLSELPADISLLKKLKIIFLSDNNFTTFPQELAECPKLEMIGFKANKIATVPENSLPLNTRWLILTDNKIVNLPDSIGGLLKLQKLMLAGNRLQVLPQSLSRCKSLELMRVSANTLQSLPNWLLEMPNLSWLAFSGNPFCKKPEVNKAIEADISDFELYEVLGEGASGVIHRAQFLQVDSYGLPAADVAIKLFKGAVTSDGLPEDELDISLSLGSHPQLVTILAKLKGSDQQGLVMSLIPAEYRNLGLPPSLKTCTRDTFKEGTVFSTTLVISIVKSIAQTICYLHQQGICHGDVYAHNILINDSGSVLLSDFGAASYIPEDKRALIQRIELRALGCLLDDLLGLVSSEEMLDTQNKLKVLSDDCRSTAVGKELCFEDLVSQLIEISD